MNRIPRRQNQDPINWKHSKSVSIASVLVLCSSAYKLYKTELNRNTHTKKNFYIQRKRSCFSCSRIAYKKSIFLIHLLLLSSTLCFYLFVCVLYIYFIFIFLFSLNVVFHSLFSFTACKTLMKIHLFDYVHIYDGHHRRHHRHMELYIYISSSSSSTTTGSDVHGCVRVVANCDKKIIKIKVIPTYIHVGIYHRFAKRTLFINMYIYKEKKRNKSSDNTNNKKKCLDSFAWINLLKTDASVSLFKLI